MVKWSRFLVVDRREATAPCGRIWEERLECGCWVRADEKPRKRAVCTTHSRPSVRSGQ